MRISSGLIHKLVILLLLARMAPASAVPDDKDECPPNVNPEACKQEQQRRQQQRQEQPQRHQQEQRQQQEQQRQQQEQQRQQQEQQRRQQADEQRRQQQRQQQEQQQRQQQEQQQRQQQEQQQRQQQEQQRQQQMEQQRQQQRQQQEQQQRQQQEQQQRQQQEQQRQQQQEQQRQQQRQQQMEQQRQQQEQQEQQRRQQADEQRQQQADEQRRQRQQLEQQKRQQTEEQRQQLEPQRRQPEPSPVREPRQEKLHQPEPARGQPSASGTPEPSGRDRPMPGAREPRESPTGIALPGIGKSEPEARPPEGRRPQPPEGTRGSEGKSLPLPGIGKGEPEARPPEGRRHQPPEGTRGSEGKSLQPSEGERGSEGKSLQPSSGERPGGKIPRGPEGGRGPEGKGAGDRPNRDGHQPEATGTAIPGIGKPEAESRPGEGKRLRQPETGRMPDGATPRSHATPGGAEFKGTGVPESRGHEPVRERRGDRDRAAPTPASSLQVTPQTAVIPQKDHAGWTLKHHRDDGAEVRVRAHALPDGRRQVTAYQNFKDPETGRRTRVYQDGRRVIHGADFVTRSAPGRPTLTIHDNGLREAYLPNKKRFFEEKFATRRDQRGHEHRIIHRTVHARFTSGRIVMLPQPVIWTYAVVPVRQVEVYLYDPQPFQPTVYTLFTDPLPSPIEVTPSCIICPPPLVSYHDTIEVYRNPLELLIDWLLAGAVDDGYTSIAPVSASYDDPQVNQLNATVASLRQELTDVSASNQALRHELEDQRIRLDLLEESPDPAREMERAPLPVPEPVRKQFSKQVKQDLLDHQEKRPLSLAQILDSREPEAYIFQVSETLEATEIGSNEECALSTGDLVRFDQVPEEGQPAARVRVITSKASSCPANSVVNVSLWDLQEMLNSYRQRLEATMEKVQQEVQPSQTR